MSQDSIERIIGRIVLDAGFRDAFLADPDQAFADFELTDAEITALKRMDAETLDLLANVLAARVDQWHLDNIFVINKKQEKKT